MAQDELDKKIDAVLDEEIVVWDLQEQIVPELWQKVVVQNHDWSVLWEFMADYQNSILEQAEAVWIDIWYSCRSWACYACACKVVAWSDKIDIWQYWIPLVDLEEDDILSCVAWLVPSENTSDIVIKKFY